MEIIKNAEIIDLCLWFRKSRLLACADLHLGYEGMLNSQGVLLPRYNFSQIKERFEKKVFPKIGKPEIILVNGDFKQEFGGISRQEWKEALDMIGFLQSNCEKLILVKGNHDNILGPIAGKKGIEIVGHYFLEKEKAFFCHGDKVPEKRLFAKAKLIVIGHEHPAVAIRDGIKQETYKCFLKGKFQRKDLIVLPSMISVGTGTDLTKEMNMSPLITNPEEFDVFVAEDKVYYMGRLGELE